MAGNTRFMEATNKAKPKLTATWECARCATTKEHTEEMGDGTFKYPPGWRGVTGFLLCDACLADFEVWMMGK